MSTKYAFLEELLGNTFINEIGLYMYIFSNPAATGRVSYSSGGGGEPSPQKCWKCDCYKVDLL